MLPIRFARLAAALALALFSVMGAAQTTVPPAPPAGTTTEDAGPQDTPPATTAGTPTAAPKRAAQASELGGVVVTGAARAQRRFDASYAANSLTTEEIRKLAPKSFADLLASVPGIHVESTGGEVQNITRLRGIPTDRGYIVFEQDGLPLFHEIDGHFFNSGEGMHRVDLMNQRVEVVRGGPAPIFAAGAAAIVNNVMVEGGDTARGRAQLTLGDTGLVRADVMQSGKLADQTYYAIGGFLRRHSGYRDNGFPNDRGGQLRGNVVHRFENGTLKLSGTYVNDHNVFYLPIPVADPRNPALSLDPYIDYFTGTMNSPSLRNVRVPYLATDGTLNVMQRDLANGRHMRFGNLGLQYEQTLGNWTLSARLGHTQGRVDFDALYSTTNPFDASTFAGGYLNAARAAFGAGVTGLRYAIAGTRGAQPYDPAAMASNLVVSAQYRAIASKFHSTQADVSMTRVIETGLGSHEVVGGIYGSRYGTTAFTAYQDMLLELHGKPRTLDLLAINANGQVLGSVTDNGVLRYTTTLNAGKVEANVIAFYLNDTWAINGRFKIDAGVRHERYNYRGHADDSGSANLGDATTLADDNTRRFNGVTQTHRLSPTVTNWTVGANYDFSSGFGMYARASHVEIPPQSSVARSINPLVVKTSLDQYEAGIKAAWGRSSLYLTGFYTLFDPLNASFTAFNPTTGRNDQAVPFIGKAVSSGVEIDGLWRPVRWFTLAGAFTVSRPQYRNLENSAGADPSAVNGNQIVREPRYHGNIRPTFNFSVGGGELETWLRYDVVGRSYVDLFNRTALPAWHTFNIGVNYKRDAWTAQLLADNITNEKGLTEGTTRTDALAGQGTREAIYGRPLFGRSVRLVLGYSW